jgi:Family of unknown function (DUF5682)
MVHVVGVRHHSPACARLVQHVIERVAPRWVLIEGPSDFNERLDELALSHELPIALFSFLHGPERQSACWAPFCDYSPEWVALAAGRQVGAELRFIDLPAWSKAFVAIENRYADHGRQGLRYVGELCRRLGMDGMDALWDHLFEQPKAPDELEAQLAAYFEALRGEETAGPRDQQREAHMAQAIAWAAAQGGEVVVVCGGYHKPYLEQAWRDAPPYWPAREPIGDDATTGSYLVPYSFRRLDSFVGYASGMPSPAFYQASFDHGPEQGAMRMLEVAVARLRGKKQLLSSADLIAAMTMARGLMRLRGHQAMARSDLLDGMASAVLKQAQEVPLPWCERGLLRQGTDPMIVEIIAALSGDRRGRLDPSTPLPGLVADAQTVLAAHGLSPGGTARRVELELVEEADRDKSRILHRLRVLGISGFERVRGPMWATDAEIDEVWVIADRLETTSDLIEAALWGGTLESAATGKLRAMLIAADGDLATISQLLGDAVFVGIEAIADDAIVAAATGARSEPSLGTLGVALGALLALWQHDRLLGAAGREEIGAVVAAAFDRGLWLLEGLAGQPAATPAEHIDAVVALRDCVRDGVPKLKIEAERAIAVFQRRARDAEAPTAIAGATLGALWSLARLEGRDDREATTAVRRAARPETVGELLRGLFALAREQVTASEAVVAVIDEVVQALSLPEFLVALPSLRLAFHYFPPAEKGRIARRVLERRGERVTRTMLELDVDPERLAVAAAREGRVSDRMRAYGLAARSEDEP